jgi:hypothetical protein
MERISSTVNKVLTCLQEKKEQDPQVKLKKHLTKKELQHIKLCNIKGKVMTLNVDSSAWLYALNFKKRELAKSLGLKEIRLRIGEVS